MAAPVTDERTGPARRSSEPIPDRERSDFKIERTGEQASETTHGEVAVFKSSGAARHVKLTQDANGRGLIDNLVKPIDPHAIAGNGHTGLDELLGWPGKDKMDCSAASDHRFEKEDVGA